MTLLEMSLSGGLLILVITLIRSLTINHLPKRAFQVLWGVALLRLLVPVALPFKRNLFSLIRGLGYAHSESTVATHNMELTRAGRELLRQRALELAGQTAAPVQSTSSALSAWSLLWLAGAGLALTLFVLAYLRHLRRFRSARAVDGPFFRVWLAAHPLRRRISIRESRSVTAPLTYGVLHPVILLPADRDATDRDTLDYALGHEYIHIKRFDALFRLVLIAALCVHWFNPLVWAMYVFALRDIELSVDEALVRQLGFENRRAYALALLKTEETRQRFNAFASGFNKSAAEERIRAIMQLRPGSVRRVAASVLVIACVLCAFCFTSAGAADYGALVESPNLTHTSIEYITLDGRQTPRGGGNSLPYLRAGSFIRLRIKGRGEGVFGFFLYREDTDEAKGQWITLDGSTHELWLEVPADGKYRIWTPRNYQRAEGEDDYFTYKVYCNCYSPDGAHLGARAHRQDMFSGYFSETYTYTAD